MAWRGSLLRLLLIVAVVIHQLAGESELRRFEEIPLVENEQEGVSFVHRRLELDPIKSAHSSFHRCRDAGEAYAASYLIHKEHLIEQFTGQALNWVNCEMASFIMMNARGHPQKYINGSVLQSVDVLDFSVIHLSTFERLLHRWRWRIKEIDRDKNNLTAIYESANYLKTYTSRLMEANHGLRHDLFNRTIVVMPFLLQDMGAGHSNLINRQSYLAACFWSFRAYYPFISVAVKSQRDYDWVKDSSGLPFYDIMLLEGLPKSASLPVASVQTSKARMMNGTWSQFDYFFFTESDQILLMRPVEEMYAYLDQHPRHLLVPHRLMTYPASVVVHKHGREVNFAEAHDWEDMQCCLERQHCTERSAWQHVSNASVPILRIFGLQVVLGNANFHAETYRYCTLRPSFEGHGEELVAFGAIFAVGNEDTWVTFLTMQSYGKQWWWVGRQSSLQTCAECWQQKWDYCARTRDMLPDNSFPRK